tara:strand:+ start:118887 stop:119243 length:357 start_codon:yes stop_codon:yes gene_type:complete
MSEVDQGVNVEANQVDSPDEKILDAASIDSNPNLDVILNIPVQVSLELGKAKMDLRELLQLGQGSVVELERAIDEPLDVLVNGALVARGEVVVVDNKFGIRLTDIVSPEKRVKTFSGL